MSNNDAGSSERIHRTYLRGVAEALKMLSMVIAYPLLLVLEPLIVPLSMAVILAFFLGPPLAVAVHVEPLVDWPFIAIFIAAYVAYAVFVLIPGVYIWDNRGGSSD